MKVLIDAGNTFIKASLLSDGHSIESKSFTQNSDLVYWLEARKPASGILSNVRRLNKEQINQIRSFTQLTIVNAQTPIPFSNRYQTPETLGSDRLAAVAGAFVVLGGKDALVADAGTCLTVEVLKQKSYLGGAISPGISMRIKAMNEFTSQLPLVEIPDELPDFGNETRSCLQCGAIWGTIFEIKQWQLRFPGCELILTGGDCKLIAKHLENENETKPDIEKTKFRSIPDLTMLGLNAILEYVEKTNHND